jgi:hypothetical protein
LGDDKDNDEDDDDDVCVVGSRRVRRLVVDDDDAEQGDDDAKLDMERAKSYSKALLDDSAREAKKRRKAGTLSMKKEGFLAGRKESDVLLVVNPGSILQHMDYQRNHVDDVHAPFPCILFFDSLKAHASAQVAKMVREWLNSEWERLKSDEVQPFDTTSMKVYSPKSE